MTTLLAEKPRTRWVRTATVDEVLAMTGGRIYELLDGELVEKQMTNTSALVAYRIARQLDNHSQVHGGVFLPPESFVRLFGSERQLRRPDTGFVIAGRLPGDVLGDGALDIAPDLVVEVISPRDNAEKVEKKLREYLAAGVRLIWAVYPQARVVRIVRADGTEGRLEEGAELTGEEILAGFRMPVSEALGSQA
jgi:Uma2 family endonuclease